MEHMKLGHPHVIKLQLLELYIKEGGYKLIYHKICPQLDNITCTTGGVTVYRAGDYVEGTWTVTIKEPAKVRWVDVEFHGATFVKWTEVEFRAPDKNFITHEEYVNSWKRVVMHSGKGNYLNMSLVVFMHYYLQKNEIAHSYYL